MLTVSVVLLCTSFLQTAAASALRKGVLPQQLDKSRKWNALHEVVGPDGVLMIYVESAGRKEYTALNDVGIYPTMVPALDIKKATAAELREGGLGPHDNSTKCKDGRGHNGLPVLQAIDASHRRAILKAQERVEYEWTAILEDDAVSVQVDSDFDSNFRDLWSKIPNETGFVRLSWCPLTPQEKLWKHTYYASGNLRLVDQQIEKESGNYWTGGCATAYMVRRNFIPQVLSIFPCCYALDTCLDFDLFFQPASCRNNPSIKCWGEKHMMGLEVIGSDKITLGWQFSYQNGILAQDNRKDISIREAHMH